MNQPLNSNAETVVAHVGPQTAQALKDLGRSPAAATLLEYIDIKVASLRQQNDYFEGLNLTRNQGKVLMLVELKKLLGVEEDRIQLK